MTMGINGMSDSKSTSKSRTFDSAPGMRVQFADDGTWLWFDGKPNHGGVLLQEVLKNTIAFTAFTQWDAAARDRIYADEAAEIGG